MEKKSTSYRINYDLNKAEYSVSYKDKKDQLVTSTESLIHLLIKNLKKPIGLKTEIPSKYSIIFVKEEGVDTASLNYNNVEKK